MPARMRPAFAHFDLPPALDQEPQPDWPLGATAQHVLLTHLRRLLSLRDSAWNGDADAQRRLRVAARRARTALSDFGELWHAAEVRAARRALARLAEAVGRGRDLDVTLALCANTIAAADRPIAVAAALAHLERRRTVASHHVHTGLLEFETAGWPARLLAYFAAHPLDLWAFVDRRSLLHGEGAPHH